MFHRTSHPCRKLVKRCLGRIIRDMDSIVHTETGLWFGQTGVQIPAGERDFLLNVHTSSGAHPAACSVGSFPSAKQPGCDIDYWPPSNAEVYNEWSCTCPPPNIPLLCLSHTHQLQYMGYFYFIHSNRNLDEDISSLPTSLWVLDWESIKTVACNKYELHWCHVVRGGGHTLISVWMIFCIHTFFIRNFNYILSPLLSMLSNICEKNSSLILNIICIIFWMPEVYFISLYKNVNGVQEGKTFAWGSL